MEWFSVKDRLPGSRKKVIAFYKNSCGKKRTVMAEYIPRFTVLAEDYFDFDAEGVSTEWTDDGENEYVAEGWHELIDNWGDYASCEVTEGPITHWMPLPAPPEEE